MNHSLELKLLYFFYCYSTEYGRAPSQVSIAKTLNISRYKARKLIIKLIEQGLLRSNAQTLSYLRLTKRGKAKAQKLHEDVTEWQPKGQPTKIPIVGSIVAGEPIEVGNEDFSTYDDQDALEISSTMLPKRTEDLFALRVNGDSMIDALVADGDVIVLQQTNTAKNGEMVAVWLTSDDRTTLKFYQREGNKVRLQPAHPKMEPIYVDGDQVQVQGKVIMVLRHPSPAEPAQAGRLLLRLDAAAPSKVQVNKSFVLAVAIRPQSSPSLQVADLDQTKSTDITVTWPEAKSHIQMRVQINAPECKIEGGNQRLLKLYKGDQPVIRFHVTPLQCGKINIIVNAFQEEYWSGETPIETEAFDQFVGQVDMNISSNNFTRDALAVLRKKMVAHFNIEEIITLCFDLGIEHENFQRNKISLSRGLIEQSIHEGIFNELIQSCRQWRPNVVW